MVIAWTALAMAAAAGLAEWLHWRRCRRIARMTFGHAHPQASRSALAALALAGALRTAAVGALGFGLLVLWSIDSAPWEPAESADIPAADLRHMVIALDVSPSMQLADAGVKGDQRRAQRAKEVLRPVLERIDWRRSRVSVVAFYGTARPVVVDTFDPEVIANILDDLPMEHAFQASRTNLYEGVKAAGELARSWPERSASLVIVSDGDTLPEKSPQSLPAAYSAAVILGLGNPHHGIYMDGHSSRQDADSLVRLALRLGGAYYDANVRDVPEETLARLDAAVPVARRRDASLRDLAIAATVAGAATLALLPVLLSLLAQRWKPGMERHPASTASIGMWPAAVVSTAFRPGRKPEETRV